MQITPLSRQNLIRIWAGLLPFLVAMPVTIGSSISLGSSSLTLKRRKKKRKKFKDESNLIHKTFKGWGNHNTSLKLIGQVLIFKLLMIFTVGRILNQRNYPLNYSLFACRFRTTMPGRIVFILGSKKIELTSSKGEYGYQHY